MKKIINEPADFVPEMLDGLVRAHPNQLAFAGEPNCVVRPDAPVTGKVALATGGGSGHLPVFLGYVGKGMLDGCAVGDVFASPSSEQMLKVTQAINSGQGVVYIFGNYGGDVMNFDMAAEMADMEDIEVRSVLVADDVASAPAAEADRRRGVAGMVFAFKTAGAMADKGGDINEVVRVARRPWPTPAPWAWHCPRVPFHWLASRALRLPMMRWKSAWGYTANQGQSAKSCKRLTR